jgi:hypothetical protein
MVVLIIMATTLEMLVDTIIATIKTTQTISKICMQQDISQLRKEEILHAGIVSKSGKSMILVRLLCDVKAREVRKGRKVSSLSTKADTLYPSVQVLIAFQAPSDSVSTLISLNISNRTPEWVINSEMTYHLYGEHAVLSDLLMLPRHSQIPILMGTFFFFFYHICFLF